MQKLFCLILISFTLSFGHEIKDFGLTTINDKVNNTKINVEIRDVNNKLIDIKVYFFNIM